MIKLKVVGHWNTEQYVYEQFQTFTKDGRFWNQIELVSPDEPFDFLLIVNHPSVPIRCDLKTQGIYWFWEPKDARKHWGCFANPNPEDFFHVFDFNIPAWQIGKSWKWLTTHPIKKSKTISGCISDKMVSPYGEMRKGRQRRIDFICKYLNQIPEYEHYGNITQPNVDNFQNLSCYRGSPQNKEDTLFPYQYAFVAENGYEKNYFTEKILDSVLSECVAFYSGCPNIEDFIAPCCYFKIDLDKPEEAVNIIKTSIDNGEWSKRLEDIRREKIKILFEFSVFPVLEKMFKEKGVL